MCKRVETEIRDGRLYVACDYNAEFVKRAKQLHGKWCAASKQWTFDPDIAGDVSDVLLDIYGDDGNEPVVTVNLIVRVDLLPDGQSISCGGVPVCYRPGRDAAVRVSENAIITAGGFPSSGGSVKNPRCCPNEFTIAKLRDIPEPLYQKMLQDDETRDAVTLEDNYQFEVNNLTAERERLQAELLRIQRRISEIDEKLQKCVLIV